MGTVAEVGVELWADRYRLWRSLRDIDAVGALPNGGSNQIAFPDEDVAGQKRRAAEPVRDDPELRDHRLVELPVVLRLDTADSLGVLGDRLAERRHDAAPVRAVRVAHGRAAGRG